MSTVGWIATAYVLIGLCFAAWMWHDSTSQDVVDDMVDDPETGLGKIPTRLRGRVYFSALTVIAGAVVAAWPVLGLPVAFKTARCYVSERRASRVQAQQHREAAQSVRNRSTDSGKE